LEKSGVFTKFAKNICKICEQTFDQRIGRIGFPQIDGDRTNITRAYARMLRDSYFRADRSETCLHQSDLLGLILESLVLFLGRTLIQFGHARYVVSWRISVVAEGGLLGNSVYQGGLELPAISGNRISIHVQ